MVALSPFLSKINGVLTVKMAPEPDLAAGKAQFFDPDLACLIQLRPLLKADQGELGTGRSGNALLFARSDDPTLPDIACFVRVPPHLRKNPREVRMASAEGYQL
ncbi:hypothetical protein [Methylobacterium sp. J-090]|uniref:hypothetical protein n=1 Tax=Methylobacterium sp. J-090 TaxID=2836666 RepID=UPI001FB8E1ED|nr:hypothetical protein [Methylobacterium sp. J-090]MCJ2082210.1 hypothetical protein [Methylobacterium sp. J-090]